MKMASWLALSVVVAALTLGGLQVQAQEREMPLDYQFHVAVSEGDTNALQTLFAKGVAVDTPDPYNQVTPLMKAIQGRRMKVAALLIEHGARLDRTDWKGDTPLRILLRLDDFDYKAEFVDMLVAKGAVKDVFALALANDVPGLTKMLDGDPGLIKARDRKQNTPLHLAVQNPSLEAAKLLLERGADPNAKAVEGRGPLHDLLIWYCYHTQWTAATTTESYPEERRTEKADTVAALVALLVAKGAKIQGKCDMRPEDWPGAYQGVAVTPLFLALKPGNSKVLQAVLEAGAGANDKEGGDTPLLRLCRIGGNDSDGSGFSRPQSLAQPANLACAKVLRGKGADLKATDLQGNTVLHIAWADPEFIEWLLAEGADPSAKNKEDQTPLERALKSGTQEGREAMLKAYRKRGLTVPDKTLPTAADFQNLMMQVSSDAGAEQERMEKACAMIKANPAMLKEWPAAASLFNNRGETVTNVLACMIANGVDVNVAFVNGGPLSFAASHGATECVRMLIAAGADVNAKTTWEGWKGNTPLHATASDGHRAAAELLLKAGAKVNARNANGETPLGLWRNGKSRREANAKTLGRVADPNQAYEALLLENGATE